ncbi:MAG TPA: GNAT family N-acetyltransferase [Candidatus Limnocylindrales bacterium]|nr:GNAT family N-acetyltransferase [Candidatus Limnocylindrales bacterium]
MKIRLADPAHDAARVAEIYRSAVEDSHVSFEIVAPEAAEMATRMSKVLDRTPWPVAEEDGRVVGYSYASAHRERAGYRWSVDISVYVDSEWHGRGVGRSLYAELLERIRGQGFVNAYAGICLPNPASVGLHESLGMTLIGVYERVGFKFDRWWDVAWYGMRLAEPDGVPPEPTGYPK